MQIVKRATGSGAGARKYDFLSALMAHGLASDPHRQKLVMRLMALITTRYNWQRDELSMGQADIARLWSVDPRTVKREMARLKALGWLVVKRAGARGRVGLYGLDLERIALDTKPQWSHIGPDFLERMGQGAQPEPSNVVPLRASAVTGQGLWGAAQALLEAEDPAIAQVWFAPLVEAGVEAGRVTLVAPSRFHASYVSTHLMGRLTTALRRSDPSVSGVRVID